MNRHRFQPDTFDINQAGMWPEAVAHGVRFHCSPVTACFTLIHNRASTLFRILFHEQIATDKHLPIELITVIVATYIKAEMEDAVVPFTASIPKFFYFYIVVTMRLSKTCLSRLQPIFSREHPGELAKDTDVTYDIFNQDDERIITLSELPKQRIAAKGRVLLQLIADSAALETDQTVTKIDMRGRHTKESRKQRADEAFAHRMQNDIVFNRPCGCDFRMHPLVNTSEGEVCTGCGRVLTGPPVLFEYVPANYNISSSNNYRQPDWLVRSTTPVVKKSPGYEMFNHYAEFAKSCVGMDPAIPFRDLLKIGDTYSALHRTDPRRFGVPETLEARQIADILAKAFPHGSRDIKRYRERWVQIWLHLLGGIDGYRESPISQYRPLMDEATIRECYNKYRYLSQFFRGIRDRIGRSNIPSLHVVTRHLLTKERKKYFWRLPLLTSIQSRLKTEVQTACILKRAGMPYDIQLPASDCVQINRDWKTRWRPYLSRQFHLSRDRHQTRYCAPSAYQAPLKTPPRF